MIYREEKTENVKTAIALLLSSICYTATFATAADADCSPLPDYEDAPSDVLVALRGQLGSDELLQIDFDEAQYCILQRADGELDGVAAAMRVDTNLDELTVLASIDGVDVWLRIDNAFPDEVVLDRATGESLGLTDAEFLGDNSLLEASDFFVEFVDAIEIGDFVIRDAEANIPRLDAPYDHYAGRASAEAVAQADSRSVGSIGETLLEQLVLTLDFDNNRVYAADAR